MIFDTWEEAKAYAQTKADELGLSYCIEKPTKYQGWSVKLIPQDPSRRFGWETRCQAVEPSQWEKTWSSRQALKASKKNAL
jgi:hypothetical protein